MESILIIDENQGFLDGAKALLRQDGLGAVQTETDAARARLRIDREAAYDVVLIDLDMPGLDGLSLMDAVQEAAPDTECVVLSRRNDARLAVECVRKGAGDYLTKPVPGERLLAAVHRALNRVRGARGGIDAAPDGTGARREGVDTESIVTRSETMRRILRQARLHARSDVSILITGESGTGKELLARAIHRMSGRAGSPFTSVNMASLAGSLFDSEFFGHTRGAFTGAERDRAGYLEHSHGGTVFLDEIADLPLDFQGKLLRVIEQGEFIRLGTSTARKADVRFISATNTDLERQLARGGFRPDLYYRLKGVQLRLPPLRERSEDIPLLVERFIAEFGRSRAVERIDGEAMRALAGYDYPGNVRELRAVIQSAVNLAEGGCLTLQSLPAFLRRHHRKRQADPPPSSGSVAPLAEVERLHVLRAYELCDRNKVRAAEILGIGVNTLRRKLALYGIR